MQNVKNVIYLIGVGVTLTGGLIVYAEAKFATRSQLNTLIEHEKDKDAKDLRREDMIIKWLERIERKIDIRNNRDV